MKQTSSHRLCVGTSKTVIRVFKIARYIAIAEVLNNYNCSIHGMVYKVNKQTTYMVCTGLKTRLLSLVFGI